MTPVCSTELAELERLVPEFEKRGVKPIGLSVDSVKKHKRWEKDVVELAGKSGSDLSYPIIADVDRSISTQYEMLDHEAMDADDGLPLTVRSVFLIDNKKKMRLQLVYPISTGRSWPEVLRAIDSIKLAERHPVATPHGWTPGGEVVVSPSISTEKAREMYPEINVVKPYLRVIPQPKD